MPATVLGLGLWGSAPAPLVADAGWFVGAVSVGLARWPGSFGASFWVSRPPAAGADARPPHAEGVPKSGGEVGSRRDVPGTSAPERSQTEGRRRGSERLSGPRFEQGVHCPPAVHREVRLHRATTKSLAGDRACEAHGCRVGICLPASTNDANARLPG